MTTHKQLLAQLDELKSKIDQAEKAEKQEAIAQAMKIISDFNLTPEELFSKPKTHKKVSAKYRDPVSGATWTGRGREPAWIKGKSRDEFVIEAKGEQK